MKKVLLITTMIFVFTFIGCSKKPTEPIDTKSTPIIDSIPTIDSTIASTPEPTINTTTKVIVPSESSSPTDVQDNQLLTKEIDVDGFYNGNTTGNLNNKGLAVYSYSKKLHYYSSQNSIYSFDPNNGKSTLIFEFDEGRPIYLNIKSNNLYFINSLSGHVFSYSLTTDTLETVNEGENLYLYVSDYIHTLQPVEGDIHYYCYRLNNYAQLHHDFSKIKFINITSNIVYYMTTEELIFRLMNYNGMGKTSLGYLDSLEVEEIFELVKYKQIDPVRYFMLIATINDIAGLYFYDSSSNQLELVLKGNMHSLNYHNNSVFVVKDDSIYEIPFNTLEPVLILDGLENNKYLQVINNWLYIGVNNSNILYQINPITKQLKLLP